jgi:hypothetical protein
MLDELIDQAIGRPDLPVVTGKICDYQCWHACEKNNQEFVFGLDMHPTGGVGYYLDRDGTRVAEGSKSQLLAALERYGVLNEIDAKITQRIFMDVRC